MIILLSAVMGGMNGLMVLLFAESGGDLGRTFTQIADREGFLGMERSIIPT
jgi:hypothetical protein